MRIAAGPSSTPAMLAPKPHGTPIMLTRRPVPGIRPAGAGCDCSNSVSFIAVHLNRKVIPPD